MGNCIGSVANLTNLRYFKGKKKETDDSVVKFEKVSNMFQIYRNEIKNQTSFKNEIGKNSPHSLEQREEIEVKRTIEMAIKKIVKIQ